jgi:hypothetical protein
VKSLKNYILQKTGGLNCQTRRSESSLAVASCCAEILRVLLGGQHETRRSEGELAIASASVQNLQNFTNYLFHSFYIGMQLGSL